jgi:hypothetical protein
MMKELQRKLHDYIAEISARVDVRVGSPLPFGTQETGGGVNFVLFSRDASRVRLELFDPRSSVILLARCMTEQRSPIALMEPK